MPGRGTRRTAVSAVTTAEVAALGAFLDRNRVLTAEFLEHQADEPPEWRDAVELANGDYWLTAEELTEVSRALRSVLQPYEQRRPDSGRTRAGGSG